MHTGNGQVVELILQDGQRAARISCPANLTPSAGQYLLASDASDAPLPVPLHCTDSASDGFIAAPIPDFWMPGMEISLRGPLGNGFGLPVYARKITLIAFDGLPSCLRGLIRPALRQEAAIVFVSDSRTENLPDEVEIQPLSAMSEIIEWADYAAFDVTRENLPRLMEKLGKQNQLSALREAELLIRTPVPCGGVAECGVCAVTTKSGWKMACKDGPVFKWSEI